MQLCGLFIPKDVIKFMFVRVHAFDFMAFKSTCKDAVRCLSNIDESLLNYGYNFSNSRSSLNNRCLRDFVKTVRLEALHHNWDHLISQWIKDALSDIGFSCCSYTSTFHSPNNKLTRDLYSDVDYDPDAVRSYTFILDDRMYCKIMILVIFKRDSNGCQTTLSHEKLVAKKILPAIKRRWRL